MILVMPGAHGDVLRQSAQYVARGLAGIGHKVREQISVCETQKQLQQAISTALGRSHILVTIGGLGAESGHITKKTIAAGLRLPLEVNNEALSALRAYCHRAGVPYSLEDNAYAMIPRGGVAFPGSMSKVPGCAVSSSRQHIVLLPEIPDEIVPMFNRYVSPYLGGKATATITRTVRTYGVREQTVRDMLGPILSSQNPAVSVHRENNEVLVRVTANAETSQQAAALCTPMLRTIVDKMGDAAYGLDVDSLQSALVTKLAKKDVDLAVAECGTDGMLGRVLGETEGGAGVLRYSADVDEDADKADVLGMKPRKMKKHLPASEWLAVALAAGVREKAHAALGAAVCAVTEETETRACPAGLVYIAVCDSLHVYVKKLVVGEGDAPIDVIIDAALSRALNMVRLFADYLPGRYPAAIPLREALDGISVTDRDSYDTEVDVEEYAPEPEPEREKRGGGGKNRLRRAVLALAILVFIGSSSYIGYTMYSSWQTKKMNEDLANMFSFGDMDDVEVSPDYPKDYWLRFAGLWNLNRDVRAFINIEGTGVRYPIVQAGDNDYYLRRDFYEEYSPHGIPFLDFRVNVEKPSDNMVIYGHNMTDGQIFGELINYKTLDYYREHPTIEYATVFDNSLSTYKIFSVFITNAYENQGPVFDYYNFIEAENSAQYAQFLQQLAYRTRINTTVDVEPGDQLITLSTCTYEFQDARLVVVARKLRRGESADVDVENASENPQPLYPDVWYTVMGGQKPGVDGSWTVGSNASSFRGYAGDETAPAVTTSATISAGRDVDEEMERLASERAASRAQEQKLAAEADAAQRKEEEDRLAEQARLAEEEKLAQEEKQRAEEEARLEAERLAEEARLEEERLAEQARLQAEEEERQRAEEEAEAARQAALDAQQTSGASRAASPGELSVTVNGSRLTGDAYDIVCQVVQNEVGPSFNTEAIKAQAVAAYTFIAQSNQTGSAPSVYVTAKVDDKVAAAVAEVIGEAVYYGGELALTTYHATSAGQTANATDVWSGGSYPYLVSVDSGVDKGVAGYESATTMTSAEVAQRLESNLGLTVSGDPSGWFEILSYTDGGYVGAMSVCGETKSPKSGSTITGRIVRETVLNLRSACFTISYDAGSDRFTFTTYGYGHGVGMSQNGANAYAAQGWSYRDILAHYYPGTSVY